jgi:hypothetical protein
MGIKSYLNTSIGGENVTEVSYDNITRATFMPNLIGSSSDNPAISPSQVSTQTTGVYWYKPTGYSGSAFQAYTDFDTAGGPWALTWIVTNANGDTVDWWDGDTSFPGATSSPDHFITVSTLGSTTSGTSKNNAKNPFFDYYSFTDMMIVENHSGTLGTKRYRLSQTNTFRYHFINQTGSDLVSSVLGSSGSFTTFTTSNLYFNYSLLNDGGRMLATLPSTEASGGISARVDQSRSYAWRGNITRSDADRFYNNDGTTTDHTVWIYVK